MSLSNQEHLVFISHSGEDTWVARQIAREAVTSGAKVFLDEADIKIGAEFEQDILDFLEKADELLVLLTPWALDRPYVWMEIGAAWSRRIPIIVILHGMSIQEFQARPNAPVTLKKRDIIKLNELDQYFKQLQDRVKEKAEND